MSARESAREHARLREPSPKRLVVLLVASVVGRLLLFAPVGAAANPLAQPALDPQTARLLSDYLQDPRANRAAILALRDASDGPLPVPVQLALADAYLRSGSTERAAGILSRIGEMEGPATWTGWAEYGLGWIALGSGDLGAARTHLERAHEAGWNSPAVATVLGLVAAGEGRGLTAAQQLAAVTSDPSTTTTLIQVAKLGIAYAYYWSGEYAAARNQFALVAREYPAGQLSDDAGYGAAWSALRAGNRDDALQALRGLADQDRPLRRANLVSRRQVNLEVREVLGNGLRRYRRGRYTMQAIDGQIADILDLDGVALARAALRRSGEALPEPEIAVAASAPHATEGQLAERAPLGTAAAHEGKEVAAPSPDASLDTMESVAEGERDDKRPTRLWVRILLLIIAAVVLAWLWLRPQSAGGVRAPRAGRDASKQGVWRS